MIPRKTTILDWDGPLPEIGQYLETAAGSRYLVLSFKPSRPGSRSVGRCDLGKLEPGETIPDGSTVFRFQWSARRRRQPARNL